MRCLSRLAITIAATGGLALPAASAEFAFSTGTPDGRIATAARAASGSLGEIETADDFTLSRATRLSGGSFTGLIPTGLSLAGASAVKIEFYRVFPGDSTNPPSGRVLTRDNSPADVAFIERDSTAGEVSYTASLLASTYTAANSVIDGINLFPNQFTGGEGAVTGQEVRFDFTLDGGVTLDAGHYFFVPQVTLSDGSFLWLSAAKPIVAPGTPFAPDLQTWIRDKALQPDWSRIGTDITGQGPFNASFDLGGSEVPEPASWAMLMAGFGLAGSRLRRRRSLVSVAA